MASLSNDVLMQILSRVCTLDLVHARCVCKRWKTIMNEPLWHKLHCSYSILNPNNEVLMVQHGTDLCYVDFSNESKASRAKTRACIPIICYIKNCIPIIYFKSFLNIFRIPDEPKAIKAKFKACVPGMHLSFRIVGSCNGLLCLFNKRFQIIYIHNPFTNEGMRLPELSYPTRITFCGFGYDSTTNNYKVVAMVPWQGSYYPKRTPFLSEIMVCECGSMMNWRSTGMTSYCRIDFGIYYPQLAFVNGRLHWMHWSHIVSFDFADEKIRLISPPDALKLYKKDCDIISFQNCLCLVDKYQHYDILRLKVWILKRYDMDDSWVREFDNESCGIRIKIPLSLCFESTKVIGEIGNGKILIYCSNFESSCVLLYEPMNNHQHKFFKCEYLPDIVESSASIHSFTLNPISCTL